MRRKHVKQSDLLRSVCQLSFRGLPCPNLGTGGHAYHGPYEHITVEGMDKAVDMITELVKIYSIQYK